MRKYWLVDQDGQDGPTALVQTDGSMNIVEVLRFGPGVTELADQQAIHDRVIGKVAPTLKPIVTASSIAEKGVEPHADLRTSKSGSTKTNRADRRSKQSGNSGGRAAAGPSRSGGRGDR